MSGSAAPWGKLCPIPLWPGQTFKNAKNVRFQCFAGAGLHLVYVFVRLGLGWFATPRFSSLSGALMCDSKKGLQPRLMAGVFFVFGRCA